MIETNQSRVMFLVENYEPEQIIRNANVSGLATALLMNPPIYASDFLGKQINYWNISKVLTENSIVFILFEDEARRTWKNCGLYDK
jgi:hypothetical protein